jgi:hypothetical protein
LSLTIYQSSKGQKTAVSKAVAAKQAAAIVTSVGAGIVLEDQITQLLAVAYGSENWEEYLEERSGWDLALDLTGALIPPVGTVQNWFDPESSRTGAPLIDKALSTAKSSVGVFTKDSPESKTKDLTRVVEGSIGLLTGIPGTGFTGTLIRGKRGIEGIFTTPAEELKAAIESRDLPRMDILLKEFKAEGLDVKEITEKALNSLKSEKKADRKEMVLKIVDMYEKAKTAEQKTEVYRRVNELLKKGVITQEHLKEVKSELAKRRRKELIGE